MTEDEIVGARWSAQGLGVKPGRSPERVVSEMLAMQGQDELAALWAVGRRAGCSEAEVGAALEEGRIVRTWPMRGTLHLLAAEDVRWMVGLLAPKMLARAQYHFRKAGLDARALDGAEKVLREILAGGPMTREAVLAAMRARGLRVDGQRGYLSLWHHAHQGLLCRGPRQGKQITFVLMDSWVPKSPALARDEAMARLAVRYLKGHGPATALDLSHWTALSAKEAREAIEAASGELVSFKVGRTSYWAVEGCAPVRARGVSLLAAFDEYLLGYKDRSLVLQPDYAERVVPGRNGVFKPLIVQDGRVVGTWRRQLKRRCVEVAFHPFEGSPDRRALRRQAEGYARFLGLELKLED